MGRGERAASKNNSKGQVWKRNVKSDDSDEDYMLEEDEADYQSDELESLCGDASDEESLGSFVEEEEIARKVVRSKSQKRSMGRMKNGINRSSKKRNRTSYDEEDDEDYHDEDESGVGDDDDGDAINKSSKKKKRKAYDEDYHDEDDGDAIVKISKERKMKAYDEEDDEDYHDEDDGGGGGSDDDAIVKSSKKRERKSYDEEDDEDYHDEDDGGSDDDDDGDDYDDDDYDDGDADADEFTLDDLDFLVEEEELPSSKGKSRKKGWRPMKKKGSVRSRKRKTGEKLLKKHGKKKRKGSSRSSKSTSSKSKKSMGKVLPSRSKHRRMVTHKKKMVKPSSDSDFVCSGPSDYEFTISEEEREQVREANEFCMRLSSNLRNSKKDQDSTYNQLRNLPRRKGKEKVEEIKNDVGKQVCGICLTKEGKNTVRGTLNCCNHFFCFACIIEWSKVESRCPLCKQRFLTISKLARSATRIDLRDVVIHVPERDQVYQPSEEELRDYLDPYENVICTECHEGGDDALMLLCDLCDSPAHTYCVGLGQEVPEGNWYCEGCRPSALGFTSSQAQDLTPAQRANNSTSNEPPMFENMAEIDLNITIPETPMTPVNGFLVSPRQPSGGGLQAPAPVSGVGVSTLSGRRRVHRLQYLLSSNRLNHTAMRVDRTSTSDRMTNFPGPWEDRVAQPSTLETVTTDVGTSYHAEGRLQENSSGPAQNKESFPGRLSLMRGQVLQVPSAADGSSYGYMQLGGVGGINLGLNCIPGREYLQPCTSNLGSGTSMSALYNRDVESLVKSQLKNLCRDMDLEHDMFKQIIRCSTNTILAACGLEHSRTEVHEMQPPICIHNEALVCPQMSLLRGCCQACFDSFVRDAVSMIMEARAPQHLGFRNY